ncbi:MAG: hypothetical protein V4492_02325 [Chlamydiota bacterium]
MKLKNKKLLTSALMMGLGTSVIYVFSAKAPFIGIELIGVSPDIFGLYNLIPSAGLIAGSLFATWLAGKYAPLQLLKTGVIASLVATFAMLIPFALGAPTMLSLFLPMTLILGVESIVFANISSFGLSTAKNKSNASAMLNCVNMSTAVVAVFLSETLMPENPIYLPIAFTLFFFLMLLLYYRLKRI